MSRRVLSLKTLFKIPEQMNEFEVLSRGSAFLANFQLPQKSKKNWLHDQITSNTNRTKLVKKWQEEQFHKNLFHIVTCSHVACPWLFSEYYYNQLSWLQHVNETHLKHVLEVRENKSGHCLMEFPLKNRVFTHASRDLSILHFDELKFDLDTLKEMEELGVSLTGHVLNEENVAVDQALFFTGHIQSNEDDIKATMQIPNEVEGRFIFRTARGQSLAVTKGEVLSKGMCGGSVTKANGECVGMIEGIVPKSYDIIEDQAAFIPAVEISNLIDSVESNSEECHSIIIGGLGP